MENIVRGVVIVLGTAAALFLIFLVCGFLWCVICGVATLLVRVLASVAIVALPLAILLGVFWLVGWLFKPRK